MLPRSFIVSRKLIGASQSKLSGHMQWIQGQATLVPLDGAVVVHGLGFKLPEKIERICVRRIDPRNALKGLDCSVGLRRIPIKDAEVVPGARVVWLPARGIQKNVSGLFEALRVEECDAFVQTSVKQGRITLLRLPEQVERLKGATLVHARDAKIIKPDGRRCVRVRLRGCRRRAAARRYNEDGD
jgi:hypothetical protein